MFHLLLVMATAPLPFPQSSAGGYIELVDSRMGTEDWHYFGSQIVSPGDVDGRPGPELIVGDSAFNAFEGRVQLFSSGDESPLWIWEAPVQPFHRGFGHRVIVPGDLDGDGFGDCVITAPRAPYGLFGDAGVIDAYSCRTGELIWRTGGVRDFGYLGTEITAFGDLDGDGVVDLLANAPATRSLSVYVISGANGKHLLRLTRSDTGGPDGGVAAPADFDGDGMRDIVFSNAGYPSTQYPLFIDAGIVWIHSSADGRALHAIKGSADNERLGAVLQVVGDLDGDGDDEWVVTSGGNPSNPHPSEAMLHSGARLIPDWSHAFESGRQPRPFRWADLDADGVDDVVFGLDNPEEIVVLSGRTGTELARVPPPPFSEDFGFWVEQDSRTTDSGIPDLFVGAPLTPSTASSGIDVGAVYRYSVDPYLSITPGEFSAASGATVDFDLDFPQSQGGATYLLLACSDRPGSTQFGGIEIPLVSDALYRRMLIAPPAAFQGARGTLDADGKATARLTLPPGAANPLAGHTVRFAAVTLNGLQASQSSMARPLEILP